MHRGRRAILLFSLCACSGAKGGGFSEPERAATPPAETTDPAPVADAGSFADAPSFGDAEVKPKVPAELYAHSMDTLYKLDPTTGSFTVVGPFQGCTAGGIPGLGTPVIDIALDESSNIFAVTPGALWSIDKKSALCTIISYGSFPNSLSFVPKGTLDPNEEALVGYEGSTYVRIDPKSGTKTNVGTLGAGLSSSGDVVAVKGGGAYLTVKGTDCNDCLVEVDPKTGAMIRNLGPVGAKDVFGLAFWAGSVYGFSDSGTVFELQIPAQGAPVLKNVPLPVSGMRFWGAGSSTSAPVLPTR
jgi:hypothetical protein